MTVTAGVDIGSAYAKAVILADGRIVARAQCRTGFDLPTAARQVYDTALAGAGLKDVPVVATGMGRHQVPFAIRTVTDLTAAARGAAFLFPGVRGVIDAGAHLLKACRVDERGRVLAFRLNDKCASGTGAFLEKTARRLGGVEASLTPVPVSSICAVFAESEVINHLAAGASPADIMRGAVDALAARALQLLRRLKAEPPYALVGGVARLAAVRDALKCEASDDSPFAMALGAAIAAGSPCAPSGPRGDRRTPR